MTIVSLENLTCYYGTHLVFENVSLHVERGKILMLLGGNGSGKTTLLKAILGQIESTSGAIKLFSQARDDWPHDTLAQRIASMPQSERRDWPLTVGEAVLMGRAPHRGWFLPMRESDGEKARAAMEQAGLAALADRPITQLSGGEWRRMILARALAQEAELLLLDEPTAGLDLRYQYEMLTHIKRLSRDQSLTFIVTIHDLNLASLYADQIALLANQKLLATGSAQEVLTKERIQEAYGIPVEVVPHPVHGSPMVVPEVGKREW